MKKQQPGLPDDVGMVKLAQLVDFMPEGPLDPLSLCSSIMQPAGSSFVIVKTWFNYTIHSQKGIQHVPSLLAIAACKLLACSAGKMERCIWKA